MTDECSEERTKRKMKKRNIDKSRFKCISFLLEGFFLQFDSTVCQSRTLILSFLFFYLRDFYRFNVHERCLPNDFLLKHFIDHGRSISEPGKRRSSTNSVDDIDQWFVRSAVQYNGQRDDHSGQYDFRSSFWNDAHYSFDHCHTDYHPVFNHLHIYLYLSVS